MGSDRLNLDNFPHSAYAHELRRGLSGLRFEGVLEHEYRVAHLQRVRTRVRIWFSASLALAILFTIAQVRGSGLGNLIGVAHVAVLVPCAAALVWLVWGRQYERFFPPAAPPLMAVFFALIAIFVARAISVGHDEQLAALTVNLVGVFFSLG